MGSVVGEKITRAAEEAVRRERPLIMSVTRWSKSTISGERKTVTLPAPVRTLKRPDS